MANALTNKVVYELMKKTVDLVNDSIKICLMASGFTFSKTTQNVWGDVSASELASANGYVQNTKVLATKVVTEDDVNALAKMSCADIVWTASGGDIGPSPGAILYDDTHASDIIVGYIDFGGNTTAGDTNDFTIQSIVLSLRV